MTYRQTDRSTDSSKAICLPFFEGGHKKPHKIDQNLIFSFLTKLDSQFSDNENIPSQYYYLGPLCDEYLESHQVHQNVSFKCNMAYFTQNLGFIS
jgi:hypothetical protein